VLDDISQSRLKLDPVQLNEHLQLLKNNLTSWLPTLRQITTLLDSAKHKRYYGHAPSADSLLYEAFLDEADKRALVKTRATAPTELAIAKFQYSDQRLRRLLPLYKARNYPDSLTITEQKRWHDYCQRHLLLGGDQSRYATFVIRLQSLAEMDKLTSRDKKILAEVDAWARKLIPINSLQSARLGQ
jgi:exodeoxyribonuclease-1